MKKLIIIMGVWMISITAVKAQEPVPLPDTVSEPVKEGDPEIKNPPANVNYLYGMIKITSKEIPVAVKQTLEASSQYTGWERASVYKDKEGKSYILEMKEADRTRVFRFDKTGKLILD